MSDLTNTLNNWEMISVSRGKGKLNDVQRRNIVYAYERSMAQGVDPNLTIGIMYRESNLGDNTNVGKAGEQGITQFMPATAKRYGIDPTKLQGNPTYAIDSTIRLLQIEGSRGGYANAYEAGLAYNGGDKNSKHPGAVAYGTDLGMLVNAARSGQAPPPEPKVGSVTGATATAAYNARVESIKKQQDVLSGQMAEMKARHDFSEQVMRRARGEPEPAVAKQETNPYTERADAIMKDVTDDTSLFSEVNKINAPVDVLTQQLIGMWNAYRPTRNNYSMINSDADYG